MKTAFEASWLADGLCWRNSSQKPGGNVDDGEGVNCGCHFFLLWGEQRWGKVYLDCSGRRKLHFTRHASIHLFGPSSPAITELCPPTRSLALYTRPTAREDDMGEGQQGEIGNSCDRIGLDSWSACCGSAMQDYVLHSMKQSTIAVSFLRALSSLVYA